MVKGKKHQRELTEWKGKEAGDQRDHRRERVVGFRVVESLESSQFYFITIIYVEFLHSYIYIHGDYSVIDDRIIFYTYSVLLMTHVCTALYDRIILLVCKF
jgi:hypothetical protein